MSEHFVQGSVTFADGKPAVGLQVRAVDCDLRQQHPVGAAATDAQGAYEIRYSLAIGDDSAKTAADLRVQVLDAEGAELAASPLHPAAPSSLVVDLRLDFSPPQASEYERLLHAIEPRLGEVDLADIGPEGAEYLSKVNRPGRPSDRTAGRQRALCRSTQGWPGRAPAAGHRLCPAQQPGPARPAGGARAGAALEGMLSIAVVEVSGAIFRAAEHLAQWRIQ